MKYEQLIDVDSKQIDRKFAVGNDLVMVSEFAKSFNKLFEAKVYTQHEIDYCNRFADPMLRFAATWAAKEAVYKAVKQLNQQALSFQKIEITRAKIGGIPKVTLHDHDEPSFQVSLSISHDGDYAWAIAILETDASSLNAKEI